MDGGVQGPELKLLSVQRGLEVGPLRRRQMLRNLGQNGTVFVAVGSQPANLCDQRFDLRLLASNSLVKRGRQSLMCKQRINPGLLRLHRTAERSRLSLVGK